MNDAGNVVYIIDDDLSVRRSISLYLSSAGFNVKSFDSADAFLDDESHGGTGCIILDVNMDVKSGFDLQQELLASETNQLPIIFITGYGNIPMSVDALRKGALNFLEKPFKDEELLRSVEEALILSAKLNAEKDEVRKARMLVGSLSPRETDILKQILTGRLNKQIAGELSITEHTVKLHRQRICEKLGVKSVPGIIRIADRAGVKAQGTILPEA